MRCRFTASALFVLLHRPYAAYQLNTQYYEQLHYDEWCKQMAAEHPQFDYWFKVWQLELLFLQFLRAQRQQQVLPYLKSLGKLIPWMFALDHYDYARWMTVHVKICLPLRQLSYHPCAINQRQLCYTENRTRTST